MGIQSRQSQRPHGNLPGPADPAPACQSRDRPQCPPRCRHSIWVSSSAHTWKPEQLGQEGRRPLQGQIHPSGTFCALTTGTRSAATEWPVPWPPVSLKTWEGPQENRFFQTVKAGSSEPGCVIWIRAGRGDSGHSSEGGLPGPPRTGPRAVHLQLSPQVAPQRTSNQSQCRVPPPTPLPAARPRPRGHTEKGCNPAPAGTGTGCSEQRGATRQLPGHGLTPSSLSLRSNLPRAGQCTQPGHLSLRRETSETSATWLGSQLHDGNRN